MRLAISSVLAAALIVLVGLHPQHAPAADYTFIPINVPGAPNVGAPGFFGSSAFGVNNAGTVVGNWANPQTLLVDGFVYSNGVYTDVAPPASVSTTLYSINSKGVAVGNYQLSDNTIHAFTYSNGTISYLSDFPGATETSAIGINRSGTIVGVYSTVNAALNNFYPFSAFVLPQGGSYTAYNYPGAVATGFTGLNDLGTIVGNYFDASTNSHGFYIPNGDLNNPATWVPVNYPGEPYTEPQAINNLGQIVGIYEDASGLNHGFIYSGGPNGTYSTLDFPNDPGLSPIINPYSGTELYGINDLGQIAGTYNNYSNGFLADPAVPEPASLTLFAVGVLGFGVYRWRRRKPLP